MLPPKIEICIEGYNIEQTDFYIAHIIDKYNSLNELYQKSCEHIVFLEKECKNGFAASLSESEKRIIDKLDSFEQRLVALESALCISENMNESKDEVSIISSVIPAEINKSRIEAEISDFHSELEGIKQLFKK